MRTQRAPGSISAVRGRGAGSTDRAIDWPQVRQARTSTTRPSGQATT